MWPRQLRSFLLLCWDVQTVVFGIYSRGRERIPQGLDVCLEVLWKQVWIARAVSNIYVNYCLCVSFCWNSAGKRQTQFCA